MKVTEQASEYIKSFPASKTSLEDNSSNITNFMQMFRITPGKAGKIMSRCHYNVNGLLNNQIKTQVKNVLGELDGVKKVNVDLHRGSIEVDYNKATNEDEIRDQIEHVGCRIV